MEARRVARRLFTSESATEGHPAAIIRDLDLLRPIYQQTAAYGHFGRELPELTWENIDRADDLENAATR
jgi:S-adenosylmethionine synthetase